MQSDSFDFPQYRKYVGIDTYYKLESADLFIELVKMGGKVHETKVQAVQYPEKLRIQDMLVCLENRWQIITEDEFNQFKNQ